MTESLTRMAPPPLAVAHERTIEDVLAQAEKIVQAMRQAMEEGIHFGRIPNTPKPTLFKAGAEKLCLLFRLDPQYASHETLDGAHLTVKSTCTLWHIPTGQRLGSGEGSCSTKESKYAYRRRGNDRVANPDLADSWNVALKMSNKRALVAAVLNVTAASDVFTQDLEDVEEPVKPAPKPVKAPQHTEVEPESGRVEVPVASRPQAAPLDEWLEAFSRPDTTKALQALWKGVTAPDLWETWSPAEREALVAAKDAAKTRLGAA